MHETGARGDEAADGEWWIADLIWPLSLFIAGVWRGGCWRAGVVGGGRTLQMTLSKWIMNSKNNKVCDLFRVTKCCHLPHTFPSQSTNLNLVIKIRQNGLPRGSTLLHPIPCSSSSRCPQLTSDAQTIQELYHSERYDTYCYG